MINAVTILGIVIIVCAACISVAINNTKKQTVSVPSGIAVVNVLRSSILSYAKQIHDMIGSNDYDTDILLSQEATCYQILNALDTLSSDAYSIDISKMCANPEDGMKVKELIYCLSACPLDSNVCVLTKLGPQKITMCLKSGDDKTAMLCDDSVVAQ